MSTRSRSLLAWGLALSVIAHVLLVLELPRVPASTAHGASPGAVALEIIGVASAPVGRSEQRPARASARAPALPRVRPAPAAEATAELRSSPAERRAAPAAASGASAQLAAPRSNSGTAAFDLRPRTAALGLIDSDPSTPACPRRQPSDRTPTCREPDVVDDSTAQDRLQRSLDQAAAARPYLDRRPPPQLHRQLDGSYTYRGPVFSARIAKDGSVSIEDAAVVQAGPLPLMGTFDLTDAVDSARGKSLYPAEKRWFMEQTADLRAELAARDRSATSSRGRLRLRAQFEHILADAALGAAQKRAEIFALWNDCADDETGTEAQRLIEQLVRLHMPRGSELGYAASELDQLNRRRIGRRMFAPYLEAEAPDAGVPPAREG